MVGSALIPEESLIVGAARQLIEDRADVANVAAVVLTADGETFAGVNVGNDVGGICAEVAALARPGARCIHVAARARRRHPARWRSHAVRALPSAHD